MPSARRATRACNAAASGWSHFYPRPPRGGRRSHNKGTGPPSAISIHALREEGDVAFESMRPFLDEFLSTPSARRATGRQERRRPRLRDFYPRPPRGGRPSTMGPKSNAGEISIHALREEGDCHRQVLRQRHNDFYPRPPRGGRRTAAGLARPSSRISIHALREEGDARYNTSDASSMHFYPRPPRGGRPIVSAVSENRLKFLSTPSARRATLTHPHHWRQVAISIHALREEGDRRRLRPDGLQGHFYPRPPRGGRLQECQSFPLSFRISIHALREEGDISIGCLSIAMRYFYPRPPRGGRPKTSSHFPVFGCISIHALREEGDLLQAWETQ